ncbi:PspC domain-containing protein [Lutibacter sp. HS1-25]|uniref:PspC domain-containing protein n=1 Tax=Lutibacter sp. HS1-25 TaxID=2485000 RepID=UPI00101346E6|nr:PspC domain-containing protein [Lutibacter sp. HS1-25]RXP58558.1 PspC domain-containing protein [Lutibacter sp. HS1-25]
MNKTISINLGGIFFHIDELAYQKLKLYLDAIRRSLSDDPQGRDEILNDIENRIGELLSERITDVRQVVDENDIDEITKIMGKPEDYLVDEEIFEDETGYNRAKTSNKKLFRDTDDKFLGGVCAGLAHYVGIEAIWMRLLWLALLFFFGTGFLVYILLWILVPQAETTAEKLQMEGEPVNISNIERKIREEFQDVSAKVKDGVNDISEKVKNSDFKKNLSGNTKSGLNEIIDTLGTILVSILNVLGKIIGAVIIFIASIAIIGLIIAAFSWGSFEMLGFSEDFINYPPFFFDSVIPAWLLITFAFLAIAIPFVILFLLGLKILSSNVKSFSTTTKLSLLGIWIISLLGLGFAGINYASQTAYDGVFKQTEELPIIANDTLTIKMIADDNLSARSELSRQYDFETVYENEIQKLYSSRINVDIKSTDKTNASIKIRKESTGKNKLNANKDAESIEYEFNITDKNLLLNGYFLSNFNNKFKDQLVDITIYLPINTVLYLDNSTKSYLDNVQNVQNIYDRNMPKHLYKMTIDGLACLDCDSSIFGDDYKEKNEKFNLKIDEDGVEVNINNGKKNANIKVDENGVKIN